MVFIVRKIEITQVPQKVKYKKTALVSRRFSVIWFGVIFGFDPKNGTPNKGKHHGVLFVPTFCI